MPGRFLPGQRREGERRDRVGHDEAGLRLADPSSERIVIGGLRLGLQSNHVVSRRPNQPQRRRDQRHSDRIRRIGQPALVMPS